MAAAHPLLAIRPATIDDVPLIRQLVAELAARHGELHRPLRRPTGSPS